MKKSARIRWEKKKAACYAKERQSVRYLGAVLKIRPLAAVSTIMVTAI